MKKQLRKLAALALAAVMLIVPAAAAGRVQKLNFFGDYGIETPQLSISGVTGTSDLRMDEYGNDALVYECELPAKVTLLCNASLLEGAKVYQTSDPITGEDLWLESSFLKMDGYVQVGNTKMTKDEYEKRSEEFTESPLYLSGASLTIADPGLYAVYLKMENKNIEGSMAVLVRAKAAPKAAATPTASTVLVDGKEVSFDAYNISGYNYFKLRDIAMALNNTPSQFAVNWNSAKNAIEMLRGDAYAPAGGELAKGDGKSKTALLNSAPIYLGGEQIELTAYNIGGNNYFKLRDLGDALGFGVDWDAEKGAISIFS